jgi:superfamily II RNA helicase
MPFREAKSLPKSRMGFVSFVWLLLATTLPLAESFLPNNRILCPTALRAGTLHDRTVKELWKILEESTQVERGLKSQLKRKEDIIQYIEQHASVEHLTNENDSRDENEVDYSLDDDGEEEEEEETTEDPTNDSEKNTSIDFAAWLDIDPDIVNRIPPFLADKMTQSSIISLLPIQIQSFQRIYSGKDTVLQAPTGSGKRNDIVAAL